MRRTAMAAALVAMLGACQPAEAPQAPAGPAPQTPDTSGPQPEAAHDKGVSVLESWGLSIPFAHHVAYDLVDHNRVGVARHRVLLEVTGGTMDEAVAGMERSLAAIGYAKASETDVAGKLDQVFRKAGAPTLVLRSQPVAVGPKLKRADAVGSIHVMWNKR